MNTRTRVGILGTVLGSAIACPTPLAAQEPPAPGLEEVVVTARKQAENVQDVPVSITAFTAETIANLGMTDIQDVALRTPGLQYGNFGDAKLSPMSLRGIVSSSGSAGADPAVGIYVDEVFVGQGAGAMFDLYDIDRVEVLRGPQGTLFGRNAIGGVLNIATKRPTPTPEASATLTYGNYDYVRIGGSVSGPMGVDGVSGKLAAVYDDRSGTSQNLWLKQDANTLSHWATRGQLQFEPSDTTTLLLTADYYQLDESPLAFETLSYNPDALLTQYLALADLPYNTNPYDRKVYGDIRNSETLDLWGVAANLYSQIGDVDVVNIISYRTHDYNNKSDTDRSPATFLYDGDPENVDRFSEELRFSAAHGTISWLAGLYYYWQSAANQSYIQVGQDLADLLGAPEVAGLKAGSDAKTNTTSLAGFASATWSASEQLDVTLGGRYTYEKKSINYTQSDPLELLGGDFAAKAHDNWSQFTPNLSARYHFTPEIMGYATISEGYKSGGYNDALGNADGIAFDPETLWNYEIGLKSELLENRLIADIALFYMDWSDIQITNDNPSTPIYDPIILNAGKAHSTGVELDLQALLTEQFRFDANLSVQQSEYDEGTLPSGEPLRRVPFAPSYTSDLVAEYRIPMSNGEITLQAEAVLRGDLYLTEDNQKDGYVASYQLYNARISYEAASGRWSATLWGKNLGDETVKQRLFDLYDQDVIGQKFIALDDPRTYGLTFRVKY